MIHVLSSLFYSCSVLSVELKTYLYEILFKSVVSTSTSPLLDLVAHLVWNKFAEQVIHSNL